MRQQRRAPEPVWWLSLPAAQPITVDGMQCGLAGSVRQPQHGKQPVLFVPNNQRAATCHAYNLSHFLKSFIHISALRPRHQPPPPVFPHAAGSSLGTGVGCQNDRINLAQAHRRKRAPDGQTRVVVSLGKQVRTLQVFFFIYTEANSDSPFSPKQAGKSTAAVNDLFVMFCL